MLNKEVLAYRISQNNRTWIAQRDDIDKQRDETYTFCMRLTQCIRLTPCNGCITCCITFDCLFSTNGAKDCSEQSIYINGIFISYVIIKELCFPFGCIKPLVDCIETSLTSRGVKHVQFALGLHSAKGDICISYVIHLGMVFLCVS